MKRTKAELDFIKQKVDFTYSHYGNLLRVDNSKPFDGLDSLGYCYKAYTESVTQYSIVTRTTGLVNTDYRVLLHEYGHIYLGHLEGIHEELDSKMIWVFQHERAALIEQINKSCGIDFGDKLLQRLIDDPYLNHSIHNIAMDMEVNTRILSSEDIKEMEADLTSISNDQSGQTGKIAEMKKAIEADTSLSADEKQQALDQLDRVLNETKVKLILPERYHYPDGTPFPDEKTYVEYFIEIIRNLDQFIKMLVNITKKGGDGDTSDVTSEDIQEAFGGDGGDGQGGDPGMQSLSDMMAQAGMTPNSNKQPPKDGEKMDSKYKSDPNSQNPGPGDHGTPERDQADQDRKDGKVQGHSGQPGCSQSGGADGYRSVNYEVDPIDMAIEKVMNSFKCRVTKREVFRDVMRKYNRGINRKVIKPTYRYKNQVSYDPTIVFCIDVSGSMDTCLIDRILKSIANKMKKIHKGLKYNVIAWNTRLAQHIQDIDPRKPIPNIASGGGTQMAGAFRFFRENYTKDAVFVLISDFEDYLDQWHQEEKQMSGYTMWGFNYGYCDYNQEWTNFKVENFTSKNGY